MIPARSMPIATPATAPLSSPLFWPFGELDPLLCVPVLKAIDRVGDGVAINVPVFGAPRRLSEAAVATAELVGFCRAELAELIRTLSLKFRFPARSYADWQFMFSALVTWTLFVRTLHVEGIPAGGGASCTTTAKVEEA